MSRPPLGSIAFANIPWYSILIVSALMIGVWLASREEARLRLPRDTVIDFLLLAVPVAIIGARLYYVAFQWELYRDNPLRILNIREGGLAIYGGVIMGLLAAWITSRRKKVSLAALLDACAPSLILGQAIGRWGNYANMEAYGLAITNPRWQWFPVAVEIQEGGRWVWHMATFFYESIWCFAGFLILWGMRKRIKRAGDLFLLYVVIYCSERAVVEGLRLDSLMLFGAVRVSQLLSAAAAVAALAVLIVRRCGTGRLSAPRDDDAAKSLANSFEGSGPIPCPRSRTNQET